MSELTEEQLEALVLDRDLEKLEALLSEFNLFDALGIARREVLHSAFLAWLLSPQETHGLGDYFLRRFLMETTAKARALGISALSSIDVDAWNLSNVEIATERHRIDILVVGAADGFVCPIENKIGADEHSDQLARYRNIVETEYPNLTPFPIFLTPDGREPQDDNDREKWVSLSYETINQLMDRVLQMRGSSISPAVSDFLSQYKRTLGRHVLATRDNIDELAYQVYVKHKTAIEHIISVRSVDLNKLWALVQDTVTEVAPDLYQDYHDRHHYRVYSGSLDEITNLKRSQGWTTSGRIVLFEFKEEQGLRLFLYIGPTAQEDNDIRQLVATCLQDSGVSGVRRDKPLAAKWHSGYSRVVLNEQDLHAFDPEKARLKIEQALKDFYANDYFPIVNAIRAEFGLEPVTSP